MFWSLCVYVIVCLVPLQTEVPAEDKRKPHQMQLTKQINEEAKVSLYLHVVANRSKVSQKPVNLFYWDSLSNRAVSHLLYSLNISREKLTNFRLSVRGLTNFKTPYIAGIVCKSAKKKKKKKNLYRSTLKILPLKMFIDYIRYTYSSICRASIFVINLMIPWNSLLLLK